MVSRKTGKRYRKIVLYTAGILLSVFLLLVVFVDRYIEPLLKDRLHTLIITGSDSLYTYTLGDLRANFFGGNVEVENLHVRVDSARYARLRERGSLPALTMQLDLDYGHIRGIRVMSLLFGKKIHIREIVSEQADIRIARHISNSMRVDETDLPLWKSIRPQIASIQVNRIRMEGTKLLYRHADTSESVKLQFDRCDALFSDVRIDSLSALDSTRIGFTKNIDLRMHDLKFRTFDSSYKMKAEWITYSSAKRSLEIDSFKLQPTLDKDSFYTKVDHQQTLYYVEFSKVRFVNTRLDRFLNSNILAADSVVFEKPDINIYTDRSAKLSFESKMGKYPHQLLLKADPRIMIKAIETRDGRLTYTEKSAKTLEEGKLYLDKMNISANNITNDAAAIGRDPVCRASLSGDLFGSSPAALQFRFRLDSSNGSYEAGGSIGSVGAQQLSQLAEPLANVRINSFDLSQLRFSLKGQDYEATADVQMLYKNLSITLKRTNEETGKTETKKFLTKILNKFVIWPGNPGPDGIVRRSSGARVLRLTTHSFFGLIWKTIFAGMQDIMMRSGRYT
ncbi:MAG TPA: hypothetical protein VFR58_00405 [Flavisolibacter sp.]|nr:hypothetical protein [Flavisolibacter sp.]